MKNLKNFFLFNVFLYKYIKLYKWGKNVLYYFVKIKILIKKIIKTKISNLIIIKTPLMFFLNK